MSQQMPYNPYVTYPYTDMYPSSSFPYQMGQQPVQPGQQQAVPMQPSGSLIPGTPLAPGQVVEESYIENILRLNRGKVITVYQTFENNTQWNAKIFRGVLETAGRDHIILSDPESGKRFLLLMVNTDYITADEHLNYIPPALPSGIR
ncbi:MULTISPECIES: spore coat protein GerQ [Brevibacillus]|jgi:spore germination protein Q|uniref:Spore germination protein n=1 Tax=Brevibacillus borstelensis AK1 TaxID=1300222 RepID=M8E134_9BACL|nr:spore coat protein GerQ [Brevibacillus borstelensis]EMT52991.1 spore germination protein [Brevibacillus borstelensis AK1]KKX55599.1 spore gernimation protein [Brevibacillus borstelensis cifa_chp40]MBE5397037.1 spore coat protein GerQ [Brevibacillus borstelensis]MCC0563375.1 spore coat protein GerQ [Brevibacillus borstelensis]MCM3471386.1 spore coat protein GerQ [Brevibacillus borstelensis]